ncbi:hypothetical protein LCM02_11610 [Lutimonas saemankumensis]|uniref:hypothetical protein n=1 Tax=Lutimonas saemankumensis TaxID=483016 RepID=UPI001CD3F34A|nr:hypothetical protein [Lutimonas saemankumensis]MCA0933102.1 hypothetical protein [Lutimonas saemankumensis]
MEKLHLEIMSYQCEIKLKFQGDKIKLIDDLRNSVENTGGTFSGDYTSGSVQGTSPFEYNFEYLFTSGHLNINIVEKPFYVSCDFIEEKLIEVLSEYKWNILFKVFIKK